MDNGNGSKFNEKLRDIYRLDTTGSELKASLARLGVAPEDVTDVILTHLHFDHAGGSTVIVDGKAVPTFPNAKHYVQQEHWAQAMNPTPKDRASFFPDDYMPLREAGLLEFTDGEGELFPGVSLVVTNGHTAAQQLPLISDGNTTLLFCCDLFPTTAHIPLPYVMAYDLRPLTTLAEKESVLERADAGKWILFFEHDPDTVACTVRRGERGIAFDARRPDRLNRAPPAGSAGRGTDGVPPRRIRPDGRAWRPCATSPAERGSACNGRAWTSSS